MLPKPLNAHRIAAIILLWRLSSRTRGNVASSDCTVLGTWAHSDHRPIELATLYAKWGFQSFKEITITRSETDSRTANAVTPTRGTTISLRSLTITLFGTRAVKTKPGYGTFRRSFAFV